MNLEEENKFQLHCTEEFFTMQNEVTIFFSQKHKKNVQGQAIHIISSISRIWSGRAEPFTSLSTRLTAIKASAIIFPNRFKTKKMEQMLNIFLPFSQKLTSQFHFLSDQSILWSIFFRSKIIVVASEPLH